MDCGITSCITYITGYTSSDVRWKTNWDKFIQNLVEHDKVIEDKLQFDWKNLKLFLFLKEDLIGIARKHFAKNPLHPSLLNNCKFFNEAFVLRRPNYWTMFKNRSYNREIKCSFWRIFVVKWHVLFNRPNFELALFTRDWQWEPHNSLELISTPKSICDCEGS